MIEWWFFCFPCWVTEVPRALCFVSQKMVWFSRTSTKIKTWSKVTSINKCSINAWSSFLNVAMILKSSLREKVGYNFLFVSQNKSRLSREKTNSKNKSILPFISTAKASRSVGMLWEPERDFMKQRINSSFVICSSPSWSAASNCLNPVILLLPERTKTKELFVLWLKLYLLSDGSSTKPPRLKHKD